MFVTIFYPPICAYSSVQIVGQVRQKNGVDGYFKLAT
jgi:hypothetical protein